jgi:integrase/recombinase XerD
LDETGLEAVLPVDKSGRVYVVGSVPLLHAEAQTVQEMLEGWHNQQLCRNLDHETIAGRIRIVERFLEVTNEFPWTWTPAMAEEFFSDLRSVRGRKRSTIRGYQNALRLFCSYVSHPDYGWDRVCEQRFGVHPAQVFFDWNTAVHVQDNEQSPAKRAFTKRELQDFFDHADDQVPLIAASGRKGWLPAYRGAVMFKLAYSYGLRFNEVRHLQTVGFSRNPHAPEFGRYGVVHVRYGKAKKGSPHKRRSALTVSSGHRTYSPTGWRMANPTSTPELIYSPARKALWWPRTPCFADSAATVTIWNCAPDWIYTLCVAPMPPI